MFTTRKVYSPYVISYTQKKKKTLKMFEKKNIKKNLEGAPSSLVVVGPDLFGAVCTVVVKISQSVKRKAYGCRNLPNFLFFLVLWLVDTFVPLKLCPPCRSFFSFCYSPLVSLASQIDWWHTLSSTCYFNYEAIH